MYRLEKFLFQLAIFLIPTNMAWHYYTQESYNNGRLIDYLLPKIYLSDLAILGVIIIYILRYSHIHGFKRIIYNLLSGITAHKYLAVFFLYLFIRAFLSSHPLSSLLYVVKAFELTVFGFYIVSQFKTTLLQTIWIPLSLSLLMQAITALYQFINQFSLLGYIYFGEPDLEAVGITTNSWFGSLKIAPYGTTPHPNILAGFIVCSIWLLYAILKQQHKLSRIQKSLVFSAKIILTYISISLSLIVLVLTQSQAAWIAFILSVIVILGNNIISIKRSRVPVSIYISGILLSCVIGILIIGQQKLFSDDRSISTRYELILGAFSTIEQYPFFGSGANTFTTTLSATSLKGQKVLFLQPVHNLLLLTLAEIGLFGLILLYLSIIGYSQHFTASPLATYMVPVVLIGVLGGLDHYLLTLQTGQLILVLLIVSSGISSREAK